MMADADVDIPTGRGIMRRLLTLDFQEMRSELLKKSFVRSSEALGSTEDIFRTREHGYRRVDDAVFCHVMNFEVGQSYRLQVTRRGLICIQVSIKGTYNRWIGDHTERVSPALIEISNQPRSVVDTLSGMKLRGLAIVCDREYLLDHFGLNVERVPVQYRPIFTSDAGMAEALRLPNLASTISIVDQIMTSKFSDPLKSVFVKAKITELMCNIVSNINMVSTQGQSRIRGSQSRREAIESAASIYRRESSKPPTIEQLAARVGLDRNHLTDGFREIFGVTPHHFGVMVRMQEAQSLLRDGSLSVSEVARRVGYEGYSSFSRAYQTHFGYGPGRSDDENKE